MPPSAGPSAPSALRGALDDGLWPVRRDLTCGLIALVGLAVITFLVVTDSGEPCFRPARIVRQ